MNASLIAIYMTPNSRLGLDLLEKLVGGGGFGLQNPRTGKITLIDDAGEFHVTDENTLAAGISQRKDTRMQFWESPRGDEYPRDLYCQVVFKSEAVVVEFGELPRNSDALLKGIWTLCRAKLDDGEIIGLVVDLRGITEEYADWDAFFLYGIGYEGPCPDALCVRKEDERLLPETCVARRRCSRVQHIAVYNRQIAHALTEC